jgi:hypothetical protein
MSRYTEILQLPEDELSNLSIAYQGYARFLQSTENNDLLPWISSASLIAALFESIIDPSKAKELFTIAANNYKRLDNNFWMIIAICGANEGLLLEAEIEQRRAAGV